MKTKGYDLPTETKKEFSLITKNVEHYGVKEFIPDFLLRTREDFFNLYLYLKFVRKVRKNASSLLPNSNLGMLCLLTKNNVQHFPVYIVAHNNNHIRLIPKNYDHLEKIMSTQFSEYLKIDENKYQSMVKHYFEKDLVKIKSIWNGQYKSENETCTSLNENFDHYFTKNSPYSSNKGSQTAQRKSTIFNRSIFSKEQHRLLRKSQCFPNKNNNENTSAINCCPDLKKYYYKNSTQLLLHLFEEKKIRNEQVKKTVNNFISKKVENTHNTLHKEEYSNHLYFLRKKFKSFAEAQLTITDFHPNIDAKKVSSIQNAKKNALKDLTNDSTITIPAESCQIET